MNLQIKKNKLFLHKVLKCTSIIRLEINKFLQHHGKLNNELSCFPFDSSQC